LREFSICSPDLKSDITYSSRNTLAVSLWAHEKGGAKLNDFHVELNAKLESGKAKVVNTAALGWTKRPGAY
jgi:hypothetical protein